MDNFSCCGCCVIVDCYFGAIADDVSSNYMLVSHFLFRRIVKGDFFLSLLGFWFFFFFSVLFCCDLICSLLCFALFLFVFALFGIVLYSFFVCVLLLFFNLPV